MTKARSALSMILRHRETIFDKSIVDLTRKLMHSEGESLPQPPPRSSKSSSVEAETNDDQNEMLRPESFLWDNTMSTADGEEEEEEAVATARGEAAEKKKKKKKTPPPLLTPRPPSSRNSFRKKTPTIAPPALPPRQ